MQNRARARLKGATTIATTALSCSLGWPGALGPPGHTAYHVPPAEGLEMTSLRPPRPPFPRGGHQGQGAQMGTQIQGGSVAWGCWTGKKEAVGEPGQDPLDMELSGLASLGLSFPLWPMG